MHESEEPVVRPYWLVDDIEAALAAAVEAGGEIAHPPMEIPGHGTFALFMVAALENDALIHEAPAIVGCRTPSALACAARPCAPAT
jgi:hypothetical protein